MEVMYTVIQSSTQDGRDRGLDYKISGFHVPPNSWDGQVGLTSGGWRARCFGVLGLGSLLRGSTYRQTRGTDRWGSLQGGGARAALGFRV